MKRVLIIYLFLMLFLVSSVTAEDTCEDSDGGIDFWVKGQTTGISDIGTPQEKSFDHWDSCDSEGKLVEYSCSLSNTLSITTRKCLIGDICVDGACTGNKRGITECIDEVGGKDITKKSKIEITNILDGTLVLGSWDYCVDDLTLGDRYCDSEVVDGWSPCPEDVCNLVWSIETEEVPCPEGMGCRDGVCVDGSDLYGFCVEEIWECSDWGPCIDDQQTRSCEEVSNCDTIDDKPLEIQECDLEESIDDDTADQDTPIIQDDNVLVGIPDNIMINSKDVEIKHVKDNMISINDVEVTISLDLDYLVEKLYAISSNGNIQINVLPEDAISKADKVEKVDNVALEEKNGNVVYVISGTKKARLLFIFPVIAEIEQDINIFTGNLEFTKRPWWHFLALGI